MNENNTPPVNNQDSQVMINAQYIKDLSFENPRAPLSLNMTSQPKIDLNIDIAVRFLQDHAYEVALNITSSATNDEGNLFELDLTYAGIFSLISIPEDQKEMILLVHCPNILFPFARRVVADVTRDGGFQPLMVNPIDFYALYYQKKQQAGGNNQATFN